MEQRIETRNSEDSGTVRKKPKISDTPVVVMHTGFILFIQVVVIWVFCS